MSVEANGAAALAANPVDIDDPPLGCAKPTGLHSPPDSNGTMNCDGSDSELSDLDEGFQLGHESITKVSPIQTAGLKALSAAAQSAEQRKGEENTVEEIPAVVEQGNEAKPAATGDEIHEGGNESDSEVLPDHYSGTVPVFKPDMKQFEDFRRFMGKVDKYGMESGIIKIVPPQEWKDSLPRLDELVKQVRVREPIKQEIMGSNGTYRQVNILHQRSYNLPQWRQLCDQSEHQPPARRGERRANADKPKPASRTRAAGSATVTTTRTAMRQAGKRRGRQGRKAAQALKEEELIDADGRPLTPESPMPIKEDVMESIEDPGVEEEGCDDEEAPMVRRMGFARQSKPKTQSTSARRKYIRREGSAMIDEAAFKDWDYEMDVSDYTPERCEELEKTYWKTLTYAPPLYGADLPGTMFAESTKLWNLNKLPNLLDVLGTKVPGVNTAYLYLGMWKATFAWHLEDVDLYSINYLHFGAPKQWYSISQRDARRFEAAMKNIWPTEAKACDQFLRHKAFLISPTHLKQNYNITVNKCVSYPGEFVVTYPYGYHSGYNLGYNCAEAVNFALDSWLPMGKIAKKCQCAQAQDSVWVDVYEIERRLRGESTAYEETEDEEDEEDEEEEYEEMGGPGLPSPTSSHKVRLIAPGRKRKRASGDKDAKDEGRKRKKIRLRIKAQVELPCCLCPNDIPGLPLLPTDNGLKAHQICALYLPETYIETVDNREIVCNVEGIEKARLDLKCLYCRSKKGACFQCSQKKCARSYHATCAAAAGVFVEEADAAVHVDGIEYKELYIEFSCRFHRMKRDKKLNGDALESSQRIEKAAAALQKGDICQLQYRRGDIFAGIVMENRRDERTLLVQVIPQGDCVEVEWKWLLLPDPSEYRIPKASRNALPLPAERRARSDFKALRPIDEIPMKDDVFVEGCTWAEFSKLDTVENPDQVKVDLTKDQQMWHYLGSTSTESRAQFTEDPRKKQHNAKSVFLDTIPKPAKPASAPAPRRPRLSLPATHPGQKLAPAPTWGTPSRACFKMEKPYACKAQPADSRPTAALTNQKFAPMGEVPAPGAPSPLQIQWSPWQQPAPSRSPSCASETVAQAPEQLTNPRSNEPMLRYSAERFAPIGGSNGFPQLPGLSWAPAHVISGHHPAAQSDASSTPMTPPSACGYYGVSSVPPPKLRVQARSMDTFQKYPFFHVFHNTPSSRYRTPYAPGRGFSNGYQGNLHLFLKEARQALSGRKGSGKSPTESRASHRPEGMTWGSVSSAGQAADSRATHDPPSRLHMPSPAAYTSQAMNGSGSSADPATPFNPVDPCSRNLSTPLSPAPCEATRPELARMHPAIRPEYLQQHQKCESLTPPQAAQEARARFFSPPSSTKVATQLPAPPRMKIFTPTFSASPMLLNPVLPSPPPLPMEHRPPSRTSRCLDHISPSNTSLPSFHQVLTGSTAPDASPLAMENRGAVQVQQWQHQGSPLVQSRKREFGSSSYPQPATAYSYPPGMQGESPYRYNLPPPPVPQPLSPMLPSTPTYSQPVPNGYHRSQPLQWTDSRLGYGPCPIEPSIYAGQLPGGVPDPNALVQKMLVNLKRAVD